ncbi:MAG: hypothetical protein ACHQ1D_00630 [Nitrososphaerales archaeon]
MVKLINLFVGSFTLLVILIYTFISIFYIIQDQSKITPAQLEEVKEMVRKDPSLKFHAECAIIYGIHFSIYEYHDIKKRYIAHKTFEE